MVPAQVKQVIYKDGYYSVITENPGRLYPPIQLLSLYGVISRPKVGDRVLLTINEDKNMVAEHIYAIYIADTSKVTQAANPGDAIYGNFISKAFLSFINDKIEMKNNQQNLANLIQELIGLLTTISSQLGSTTAPGQGAPISSAPFFQTFGTSQIDPLKNKFRQLLK